MRQHHNVNRFPLLRLADGAGDDFVVFGNFAFAEPVKRFLDGRAREVDRRAEPLGGFGQQVLRAFYGRAVGSDD